MRKNPHAVALGRLGGRANKGITSPRKRLSSQLNGRKGGWWSWHKPLPPSPPDTGADRGGSARIHPADLKKLQ
jgi:hypothetical protein